MEEIRLLEDEMSGNSMAVQFDDATESVLASMERTVICVRAGNPDLVRTNRDIFWNAAQAFYHGASIAADKLEGDEE